MTTKRFFGNPQFLTYARLLRKLHQLIREGTDETKEGESLRNLMDEPGEYLTHDLATGRADDVADEQDLQRHPVLAS